MFDPHSPRAIADAISEAIARTAELQNKGLEQVRKFTWENCANSHEDAYRFAVKQHSTARS
jgi:glycosyltransferase involved in cell wall biosynthesis